MGTHRRQHKAKQITRLAALLPLVWATTAGAQTPPSVNPAPPDAIAPAPKPAINVTVNGEPVPFPTQGPVQQGATILVPMRSIFERLGATVKYDGTTRVITAVRGPVTISLTLGDTRATVSGAEKALAVPAQSLDGVTLVPLRFVSEALGAQVKWDGTARLVRITLPQNASAVASAVPPETMPPAAPPPTTPAAPPVTPPPAEPTPAPTKPQVMSVEHDAADKLLKGGDVLTVTVMGTPNATGTFTLPGLPLALNQPLAENKEKPGTYTGTYTVPVGVTRMENTVTATLTGGEMASDPKEGVAPFKIDAGGPEIAVLGPMPDATVTDARPRIYGSLTDVSKVEGKATHVFVNGQDVTGKADITEAFFSYKPASDLEAGPVTVAVTARDGIGNESRLEWTFTAAPPAKPLQEVIVSPLGTTLGYGETVNVRAIGMPGAASAQFAIGSLTNQPLTESAPGVYTGSYTVRSGDSLPAALVTVTLTPKNGKPVSLAAKGTVTLLAGPPTAPIIDRPVEGATLGSMGLTVSGRSVANYRVRISVRYEGRGFLKNESGPLSETEVTVDSEGKWTAGPFTYDKTRGLGNPTITVTVTTLGPTGITSPSATVRVKP